VAQAEQRKTRVRTKLALFGIVVLALVAIAYVADVVTSRGEIPRGVAVSGVAVGGMSPAAAEQKLRAVVTARRGTR